MDVQHTSGSRPLARAATVGVVGGLVAAIVMAMYAMIANITYKDGGFFTPLYHIASAVISPKAMMTSMERAAGGQDYYFTAGPAIVGVIVHMMTGAITGAIFGVLAWVLKLRGAAVSVAGLLYGLLVLVANAFIGLPIVAALFGGGDPIADMPKMVGWGTFTIEHALFGLALGITVAALLPRPSTAPAHVRSRRRMTAPSA